MKTSISDPAAARRTITELAQAFGFDAVGFAPARYPEGTREGLASFLAHGHHGDMAWMEEKSDKRQHPAHVWPAVRSIIVLGMNYAPDRDPMENLAHKAHGNISVYARGKDYHDVIKGRLKQLCQKISAAMGGDFRVYVDTAPVMEKPLAALTQIGWQGKHTCVVSRAFGSWLFLGEIFTDLELPPDAPEDNHCGTCSRCVDICPTRAFPEAGKLDARRCISYLTIEHKGHIAREFREAIGNRVYGCDDCLAICPWNKFAQTAQEMAFQARESHTLPPLAELLELDDAAFRARFAGTAVKRTGRDRFLRNALIAAGNSGETSLLPQVEALLGDASPLVRAMAVWALSRLASSQRFAQMRQKYYTVEPDAAIRGEWEHG